MWQSQASAGIAQRDVCVIATSADRREPRVEGKKEASA
jgi:hypothetical protein